MILTLTILSLAACSAAPPTAAPAAGATADETAASAQGKTMVPFIRMDKDDPNAWKGTLDNVRLLKGNLFEYGPVNEKYKIDANIVPSKAGLDTLNISGSAQFSAPQFAELADTLRECADGRNVYIIDLRQESHVLVNEGIPLSWYGSHNWANKDMTLEE